MAGHDTLSPSEIKELLDAFTLFDKDKDGSISSVEFRSVLVALGYSEEELDSSAIWTKADLNNDGVLTFQEYEHLIYEHMMPLKVMEKQIKEIFDAFDKGKKGYMNEDDFRRFLCANLLKSTEEEMYCTFEKLDARGDGKLYLEGKCALTTDMLMNNVETV